MSAPIPSSSSQPLPLPADTHALQIRTSAGPGLMNFRKLQGFAERNDELHLDSILDSRIEVLDSFADAMLASGGRPHLLAHLNHTLQVAV